MKVFYKLSLLYLFAIVGWNSSAQASVLTWDRTEARIEMKPGETDVRATFKVTNNGDKALRIADIRASCGCTGSVIDRRIIEPGQSTEIEATFNKGKRKGKNHTKLEVYLDSQPKAVATLHMIVDVPELVKAEPRIVYWNERTSKSPRTIRVQLDERYLDPENVEIKYDQSLFNVSHDCLLYTSPSPRDGATSRMPSSA